MRRRERARKRIESGERVSSGRVLHLAMVRCWWELGDEGAKSLAAWC
jgi:hypothetical protein